MGNIESLPPLKFVEAVLDDKRIHHTNNNKKRGGALALDDDQAIDVDDDGRKRKISVVDVGCGSRRNQQQQQHQYHFPDELVAFELFTRLPLKKLHQLKCVSKSLRSIILSPQLFEAFRRRNPNGGLLVSVLEDNKDEGRSSLGPAKFRFYYSTLQDHPVDEEPEQFVTRLNASGYEGVTQVVNGLACFYVGNRVFACNVCSGEFMRLPDSNIREDAIQYSYYLGFDPVNKVYKLLKWSLIINKINPSRVAERAFDSRASSLSGNKFIFPNWESPDYSRECEVLTLGRDSSWRKLHDVVGPSVLMPFMFEAQSFLAGRFLYWLYAKAGVGHEAQGILFSFDLNKEKFIPVKGPKQIEPDYHLLSLVSRRFAQFKGRLATLCTIAIPGFDNCFFIDTLDDETGEEWTKHIIQWPSELGNGRNLVPVGNLPTGQILFANVPERSNDEEDAFTPIYSYDHQTNKVQRFVVGQFPRSLNLKDRMAIAVSASCMVEKIDPLDDLFRKG